MSNFLKVSILSSVTHYLETLCNNIYVQTQLHNKLLPGDIKLFKNI